MGVFAKHNKKLATDNYVAIMLETDATLITTAIQAAMIINAVISFNRTKDGKSVCITVYDGEDNEKEYAADSEELKAVLEVIIEAAGVSSPYQVPNPPTKVNGNGKAKKPVSE